MKEQFPKRKKIRLKEFDYASNGAYFVTICSYKKRCVFSNIVGRGLAPAEIECTPYGEIARKQLLLLEERYTFLKVAEYVIMPNHIHVIFCIEQEAAGASPRPTVVDVICAYKSLTVKACRELGLQEKLFQNSFYDHIIRNTFDYQEIAKYIQENPTTWQLDQLYSTE